MIHPSDMMRSYILDMESYNLAEQAGMFCECLRSYDVSVFEDTKFIYSPDEPYAVHFIWDKNDLRIQLSFKADADDSVWSIINGKRRFKGIIGKDPEKGCDEFMQELCSMMKP